MDDILSGNTNIITNISYIYGLIAEAKSYGLKQVAIDGKYIDSEKQQILLEDGYKITIKFSDMGTYPTYIILWENNEPSVVIPSIDYILILSSTGSSLSDRYDFVKTNIFKSGTTFYSQTNLPITPLSGFTLYSNNTNDFSWKGSNGYTVTLSGSSNTGNRVYTFPNNSGTIALLSDLTSSSASWGNITGTLSGQTDLQSALDGKAPIEAPTFITSATVPIILGGTTTTSAITIQPTSATGTTGADINFKVGANGATTALQIKNNSNVLINSTTDTGEKLQVNGTSKFTGNTNIVNSGASGTTALSITGTDGSHAISFQTKPFVTLSGIALHLKSQGSGGFAFFDHTTSFVDFYTGVYGSNSGFQGSLIIGDASIFPNSKAILELTSTTKGFLPPRMTSAQRLAIESPAIGLHVYQTDATEGVYVNKSTGWVFAY